MEVSSHSLVLSRVAGIDFAVGAFTNLTQDHLDFHHTMDEYAAAKAMLFSVCRVGCINIDDKWADNTDEERPMQIAHLFCRRRRGISCSGEYKAFRKGRELYGVLRRKARRCEPCHTGKIFGD